MARIVDSQPHNVTVGVIDKEMRIHEKLKSVTFEDHLKTLHTVFAHVDGPFTSNESVVQAWEDGTLHTFDSHEAAIEHYSDKEGAEDYVAGLRKLVGQQSTSTSSVTGEG